MPPNVALEDQGPLCKEPADHPAYRRVAAAAAELNERRERWLNPPEWVEPLAAKVDAADSFSDVPADARPLLRHSAIMALAAKDSRLKKRTLTNLHNERPTRLHSEAVDHLVAPLDAADLRTDMLRVRLTEGRQLDARNAQPGSIGADFNRFRMEFWNLVNQRNRGNAARQAEIARMNEWRNAIVHENFDPAELGRRTTLRLADVRRFRNACDGLAPDFDSVARDHLTAILGMPPWQ